MAEARCPASCGELIQGWILGGEKLISCPVNWFSTVSVTDGAPGCHERPRMRQMLRAVLAYFDQPADTARGLHIDFDSTIPVAKGLASSTADIAATALATARHLGETLEEATLAALCVSLEPTDSTLFRQLTLFDHQTAATQISYDWQPKVDILLLESPHILNTEDYHRRHRQTALLASAASLERAWQLFTQAAERHDNALLGQSTTLSAQASQHLLVKPDFPALLALVEELDLYGLNVAHSGSVVGLLFDRQLHDIEQIYWQLHQRNISQNYPRQHLLTMVPGGVR
ncbi:GHMP kinase [Yersinia kristensenii]|uniref:GHMP family kinase ATP-binding protein n=1 Tax=Yersinia kristensenii TaxID=28152 RepID=UPI0005E2906B|nr:GHMP kinase [Yersinia kristensenii]MDA5472366.1 GHMP kinase [Yersinia kristensenii]MDA5476542.1 GHMP kinase [Yersinia kristensenii]MDA5506983.1 GHMP kinase [Yersinia kristensenii]NIK96447.1 GHMP kinase [Yersinia kristensenii]NIL08370.1 GHMP kinase [Yersinia kristensenii]